MKSSALNRRGWFEIAVSLCFAGAMSPSASAIPSFESIDYRLPNPDRPYEMVGGTAHFDSVPHFAVYDLEFWPSDPSQLEVPTRNPDGSLEFDSTFEIKYKAVVSVSTQPPHSVGGFGMARARGFAPADAEHHPNELIWPNPQVFETELVELNLFGLSPIPEVMFRESPTLRSSGVIVREDTCPYCLAPVTFWKVSSFFDIASEITFNGGVTWTAARDVIHVEQAPDGFPPGDYNKDHVVDVGDFVVWQKTRGDEGAGLAADGDWSGKVDAGDLEVLRRNFGHTAGGGPLADSMVPEPVGIVWIALGSMGLLMRRKCTRALY